MTNPFLRVEKVYWLYDAKTVLLVNGIAVQNILSYFLNFCFILGCPDRDKQESSESGVG